MAVSRPVWTPATVGLGRGKAEHTLASDPTRRHPVAIRRKLSPTLECGCAHHGSRAGLTAERELHHGGSIAEKGVVGGRDSSPRSSMTQNFLQAPPGELTTASRSFAPALSGKCPLLAARRNSSPRSTVESGTSSTRGQASLRKVGSSCSSPSRAAAAVRRTSRPFRWRPAGDVSSSNQARSLCTRRAVIWCSSATAHCSARHSM